MQVMLQIVNSHLAVLKISPAPHTLPPAGHLAYRFSGRNSGGKKRKKRHGVNDDDDDDDDDNDGHVSTVQISEELQWSFRIFNAESV